MKYQVIALRRAEADVRAISHWIDDRSPQGASSWIDAYQELLAFLAEHADSCAAALENDDCHLPLKQSLFGTRQGSTYRAVFTIVGHEARILRIRGPGQPALFDDELQ